MGKQKKESDGRKPFRTLIKLAVLAIGAVAIYQELQKPQKDRHWHGAVGGVVPYDFRPPTLERIKERLWNPEGALLSRQVVGVGWTVNFGALWAKARELMAK